MSPHPLKSLILGIALCAPLAQAATLAGMTNAKGYGLHQLQMQSAGLLTVEFLSGLPDATLSIYNAAGQHLLSTDDQYLPNQLDLDPLFSIDLAAGDYTLLVSYCCAFLGHLAGSGAQTVATDGYHAGDYYLGGNTTLSSMKAHLDGIDWPELQPENMRYLIAVDGAQANGQVPEPASLLLAGAALALIGRRRRQIR